MKKITIILMAALLAVTSCGTYTGNGTLIGTGAGAALGAGVGALIGKGKGAAIGAGVGAALGAGTGALIGKHMDKKKAALAAQLADQANVETITDANGLTAIKVTFDADMTFATGKAVLSNNAKAALAKFAAQMNTEDMINTDIQVLGHTDNTGSAAVNERLSLERAQAVTTVLRNNNMSASRISEKGCSYNDPIADNSTAAGRKQNRRVEVYVLATDAMIEQYNNGSNL